MVPLQEEALESSQPVMAAAPLQLGPTCSGTKLVAASRVPPRHPLKWQSREEEPVLACRR